jgi:hypothetical protein
MSSELRSLQSNLAYINKQVLPETKDQAYQKELAMIQTAFNSVAGFDDGSKTPTTYKGVMKHTNQSGWWASMKKEFHSMETMGVLEAVLMYIMPSGRKVVGNRWVLTEKDDVTLRSRTVPQGFSRVSVNCFTES